MIKFIIYNLMFYSIDLFVIISFNFNHLIQLRSLNSILIT